MDVVRHRARFDWLIELGGALVFGLGCAYAALKLAPSFALAPPVAAIGCGTSFFLLGMLALRAAHGGPATHRLADFAIAPVESTELLLDLPITTDELLLEVPFNEPLLLDTPFAEEGGQDVLLLEDELPKPDPASRVVQLFASLPMPTPGQLKERIDRHLAGEPSNSADRRPPSNHASEALYAALDELRRSLR